MVSFLEPCDVFTEAHHVDENSDFVQTLLKCYEKYSGKKGECLAIGGGTYVHHLKKWCSIWLYNARN